MKVIFLDLDGPLFDNGEFIKEASYCLSELVRLTGAKIVITSDWRIGKDVNQVMSRLSVSLGITTLEVIGITDVVYHNSHEIPRGAEIKLWLEEHLEDIESYVIIDDSEDSALVSMSSHLVLTGKQGFQGGCFREALRILG